MFVNQIPGYERACARADAIEDHWRDFAFLGLNHDICGVEVRPLSLRMFLDLCVAKSPFMEGGRIGPEDVAVFLWRISPQYDSRISNPDARSAFVASIAHLPFRKAVRAINRFIDRMLIDKPPSSGKSDGSKSDTSFAASIVHELASTYGWSEQTILNISMPRLFQYLRRIHRSHDPKLPRFNPIRDKLTQKLLTRALEERNRLLAEKREREASMETK